MQMTTMDNDETDPYIEQLRKKYLQSTLISSMKSSSSHTAKEDVQSREVVNCSPSSMLTESEQRHYNRAMQELQTLLQIGGNKSEDMSTLQANMLDTKTDIINVSARELNQRDSDDISNDVEESELPHYSENTLAQSTSLPTMSSEFTATAETQSSQAKPRKSVRISVEPKSLLSSETPSSLEGTWPGPGILRTSNMVNKLEPTDVKVIHAELMNIHRKLMEKSRRLAEQQMAIDQRVHELIQREEAVAEQEEMLAVDIKRVQKAQDVMVRLQGMEAEVEEKMEALHEHHSEEVTELTRTLHDKMRDMKRLKNSFDILKTHNDELKSQTSELSEQNHKLLAQNSKLKKRLENMQRKYEYREQKKNCIQISVDQQQKKVKSDDQMTAGQPHKSPEQLPKVWSNSLETLSVALEWICEFHLKPHGGSCGEVKINEQVFGKEYIVDKCLKALPLLVEVIRYLPMSTTQSKHHLPYLRFVHFALHHLEDAHHALLSSTARRIGEELLKPSSPRVGLEQSLSTSRNSTLQYPVVGAEHKSSDQRQVFFRSPNAEVRLLSSFIILRTLHQVDMLAQIFDQLKKDLKEESNREFFLEYAAVQTIIPYLTYKSNKALLGSAVDVMLQMTVESDLLPTFLECCSCERYFKAFSSAVRSVIQSSDTVTLEKMSIILQKLSKIKGNRKYFDSFSIGRALQEKYLECDLESSFLSLNLRSILFNLNLIKAQ